MGRMMLLLDRPPLNEPNKRTKQGRLDRAGWINLACFLWLMGGSEMRGMGWTSCGIK